jgi:hypothetical protein
MTARAKSAVDHMLSVVKKVLNKQIFGSDGPDTAFAGSLIQFSARASFSTSIDTWPVRASRYDWQAEKGIKPAWCLPQGRRDFRGVPVERGVFLQETFRLMPHD